MRVAPSISPLWPAAAGRLLAAGIFLVGIGASPPPAMAQSADLSVVKSVTSQVNGTAGIFTIEVTNNGPGSATGVVLTDTLPTEALFSSVSSNPPGLCTETSGVIVCTIGDLGVGQTVTVTVEAFLHGRTAVVNTAVVRADAANCDPDPSNNASSATLEQINDGVELVGIPELQISKSDVPDPVVAGQQLTYIIDVFNAGPGDAPGTIVTDTLPSGVQFVEATTPEGECTEVNGVVICELGTIEEGTGRAITVSVVPQFAGTLLNAASVRASGLNGPVQTAGVPENGIAPRDNTAIELTTVTGTPLCTCCAQDVADLVLTKTAIPNPVIQGEEFTVRLVVTNNGPAVATNVVVTDPLPAELSFVSAVTSKGTVSQAGGVVTAQVGTLNVGESATIDIVVTANFATHISNTATATADQADPTVAKAPLTIICNPRPEIADLQITKLATPSTVQVGEQVTFTIAVLNDGPSSATGVIVTDPLPAGLEYVSSESSQGFTTFSGNTVTANLGTLEPGTSATVTIVVTAMLEGIYVNTATVRSNQTDPTPASATAVVKVLPPTGMADLELTKTVSVEAAVVGEPFFYFLTVLNNGPDPATGVTIVDPLPAEVDFISASVTQGFTSVENGTTVTAEIGTLEPGTSATLSIEVVATTQGLITNTATATANEADPTTATAEVSVTAMVPPEEMVDLAVTKTASPDPVKVGGQITYNITVTNAGPADATDVVVTDTLSNKVIFVSAGSSQGTFSRAGQVVTFELGTLAAGGSATAMIVVFAKDDGTVENNVTVTSAEVDSNPDDNSASATTTVTPLRANLTLTKTASPDPAIVGQNLTYTLVVTNTGPDSASNVRVVDTLPAGVTFVSASSSVGDVVQSNDGALVVANIGVLQANQSATITIVVIPTNAGLLVNTARATSSRSDPVDVQNEVSVIAQQLPGEADLSVTKTANPTEVEAGNLVTYTVTVSNAGPATATNVVITETLPANSELISFETSMGVTDVEANGVLIARIPTLEVGQSASLIVVVRATGPEGTITNNVTVTSDQPDGNTGNNSASVTVRVRRGCCPDLTGTWTMLPIQVTCDQFGCTIDGWLEICNIGRLCPDSAPEVFVDFYLSDDANFDLGDTLLQCTKIRVPRGGRCFILDLHAAMPGLTDPTGKFVIAVIDTTLGLDECREFNNFIPVQIGSTEQLQ